MRGSWRRAALLLLAMGLLLPSSLEAQQPQAAPAEGAKPATDDKNKIPEPVELKGADLVTKDGVSLAAIYYPSNQGKKAVPVVLLHSFKSDHQEFGESLCLDLQKLGYAVLAPDLRFHGGSTTQNGETVKIETMKTMPPSEYVNMYVQDMEAIRSFLVKENDDRKLNLNALVLVGSEMGASVAVHFAGYNNCALPRVEPGLHRQPSPDVKGLVLISPAANNPPALSIIKGLGTYPALKSDLPMLILVGTGNRKSLKDADQIKKLIKPYRPKPKDESQKQTFFYGALDTTLEGADLFTDAARPLNVNELIQRFLKMCVVDQSYPWRERRMSAN
jgi:pimeloyl-ACP methyl ester carboxylesterase